MNWLESAPVLQIFLAEALAKPTAIKYHTRGLLEHLQSDANMSWAYAACFSNCCDWLHSGNSWCEAGSQRQRWIPTNRKFSPTSFWQKNMKIFRLWYLISIGKKESYDSHVLFNFSIHWQLGLNGQCYTLFIYFFNVDLYSNSPKCLIHLWILWNDKQKYTAAVVLWTVFPFGIKYRHEGTEGLFRVPPSQQVHLLTKEGPLARAMPFMTLLLLRPGDFLEDLDLWEDSCPFEKSFRLHFTFHLEGKT